MPDKYILDEKLIEEILEWNYKFPLDRWWREKHNVALFSKSHLSSNQINIAMEYIEDKIIGDVKDRVQEQNKKIEEYNNGIWIAENKEQKTLKEDLFDKLDVSNLNTN